MIRDAIDGLSAPDGRDRLVRAVSWMFLFAALHGSFRYLSRRGMLVAARRVELNLRQDVFGHVIRLPLSFFGATSTGDVMSRMTNDVSAVWLFLGPGLLTLVGTVISYLLALFFMFRISPVLTAVSLALAPAVILVSREYGRAFHRMYRKVQEALAAMNATLQENISGIRLVKAYGLEEKEQARFGETCTAYYGHNISVSRTSAVFHGAIGFLAGAGVALVLLIGGWLVIRGRLTLGGFVAFNAYLAMLAFPTMALGWVINLVQRGGSAMGRINEFLRLPGEFSDKEEHPDAAPKIQQEGILQSEGARRGGDKHGPTVAETEAPGAASAAEGAATTAELSLAETNPPAAPEVPHAEIVDSEAPAVTVRDLSFAYEGDGRGEALRGITFSIHAGEVVGLVGPTGSGKSTLLSLFLRLYPVPSGTMFLEGRDVNAIPLAELRRSASLVAQDPFLFSESLLENICFALPAPSEEAARRAAEKARFLAEIEEMPGGLRAVIGERGISLSGGQKQRAAIARTLCADARLLLLDDALSSVDAETEQEIFREILSLRGARTILFSTHRMASLSRCDRILVLSGGTIVEEGTHDELLSRRGEYYDLYSRQMLSWELEASP